MQLTEETLSLIGDTKTDLAFQIDAILHGRKYEQWPNEGRRLGYESWRELHLCPLNGRKER